RCSSRSPSSTGWSLSWTCGAAEAASVPAYVPSGAPVLIALAALLAALLGAGFVLMRRAPDGAGRAAAWLVLVGGVAAADRLCLREPPGFRMLALIAAGLMGMKAIVLVEERRRGLAPL